MRLQFKKAEALSYFVVPFLLAYVSILKVFILPNCFAFDANDDAQSFASLFVARQIIKQGQWPMMNLFNNFGMPILGDCLTYPFAPNALTYWFLPDYVAMTVNRFIIVFLSLFVLTAYYRRYMKRVSATVCAFLALTTPGFLHNLAHHHYQLALLLFTAALIFQERFAERTRRRDAFLLYAVLTTLTLSTNANVVGICFLSLFINQLFVSAPGRRLKQAAIFVLLALAAFIFNAPDYLSFFQQVGESIRLRSGFAQAMSVREIGYSLMGMSPRTFTNCPWPFLASGLAGMMWLVVGKDTRALGWRILVLGLVPIPAVFTLLVHHKLLALIPLVRTTELTRFWWVSNVFLILAVGRFMDAVRDGRIRLGWPGALLLSVIQLVLLAVSLSFRENPVGGYRLPVIFFWVLGIVYVVSRTYFSNRRLSAGPPFSGRWAADCFFVLFASALCFARTPLSMEILELQNCRQCQPKGAIWYAPREETEFQPAFLLKFIKPFSRIATEGHATLGHGFRAAKASVLGSSGLTPLLDAGFFNYLHRFDLINVDPFPAVNYHFKRPWNKEMLAHLGIAYVMQVFANPDLEHAGWTLLAQAGAFFLYENPEPVSLVYVRDGARREMIGADRIQFRGNGLTVELPRVEKSSTLVATFVAKRGWKAEVDGQLRSLQQGKDQLINVTLEPGDRMLRLDYAPFRTCHFLLAMTFSLAFAAGLTLRIRENSIRS